MAKVDIITIKGKRSRCLNIDRSVGAGGRNQRGDVMLIQAFLRYIGTFDQLMNDGDAIPEIPELNGSFDVETGNAIRHYQQWFAGRLLYSDGRIDPASYKNRNIKDVYNPLMTITFLHIHAKNAAKFYAHYDYVSGMCRSMPILLAFLNDLLVGLADVKLQPKKGMLGR